MRKMGRQIKTIIFTFFILSFLPQAYAQTADFSSDTVSGCGNATVFFQNQSPDTVNYAFLWDFGNGNTSFLVSPGAIYINPGAYTVKLYISPGPVFNASNILDSMIKIDFINIYNNPVAGILCLDTMGCNPFDVQFFDNSTSPDGNINYWEWNFNDGTNSNLKDPSHTYTTSNVYAVTLFVRDDNGCEADGLATHNIEVNHSPIADFTVDAPIGCAFPHTVNFQNYSSISIDPPSPGVIIYYEWDFGDNSGSNLVNPPHTYNSAGGYDVQLIAVSDKGCSDTIVKQSIVEIGLDSIYIDFSDTAVCAGETVHFTGSTNGTALSWFWDFGDGNTSVDQNPVHVYQFPGTYNVSLTVEFDNNCVYTQNFNGSVIVSALPSAAFTTQDTASCLLPYTVNFNNTSAGGSSYLWDFGDGNTSQLQNPSHIYTSAGTYSVYLTVWSDDSCLSVFSIQDLVVIELPTAHFVVDSASGCLPFTVFFQDSSYSNEPIVSWLWDFGDSTSSTLPNPVHTYTTEGEFDITLQITNASGCTGMITMPAFISVGTKPIPAFTSFQPDNCRLTPVEFTSQSSNFQNLTWLFGDGESSSSTVQDPDVEHIYQDTGIFDVMLIAYNYGCPDTLIKPDEVSIYAPLADISLSGSIGCDYPHTVSFTNNSIGADNFVWRFGDGDTSIISNPNHTFSNPGSYDVWLITSNTTYGCVDSTAAVVHVSKTTAGFETDKGTGCHPLTVQFQDTSLTTGNIVNWYWDFGDGDTSSMYNPVHIYDQTGTYSVYLIVTEAHGCTDSIMMPDLIDVRGPSADFFADSLIACKGIPRTFTSNSSGTDPIASWDWDLGNGDTSVLSTFTYIYPGTGFYDISLIVTDINGCQDTNLKPDYVFIPNPQANFTTDKPVHCAGYDVAFTNQSLGSGLSHLWDLGDGTSSTLEDPVHQYAGADTVPVTLTITDNWGCVDVSDTSWVYNVIPLANFGAFATELGCAPAFASFVDSSTNDVIAWLWDFGDGDVSFTQNPTHLYAFPGHYDVTLIVTSLGGCTDTIVRDDFIFVNGPIGSFSTSPSQGCWDFDVLFIADTSNTSSVSWDFGDGTVVQNAPLSISHNYAYEDDFTPFLLLEDYGGCTFAYEANDIISRSAPLADFYTPDPQVCIGDSVPFFDLTVLQGIDSLLIYEWDFGDGGTDSIQNPVHVYSSAGTYTVSLVAITLFGCPDTIIKQQYITVYGPELTSDFIASDTTPCPAEQVNFTDQSSTLYGSITAWQWDFGNGQTASTQNSSAVYQSGNIYTVSLTVEDTTGCTNTAQKSIYVENINADFNATPNQGYSPLQTVFTDISQSDSALNSWNWDFGDGSTAGIQNPSHLFAPPDPGKFYDITLIVTSISGCADTTVKAAYIWAQNNPPIAVDDTISSYINTSTSGNVGLNDSDPDPAHALTFSTPVLSGPSHGNLSFFSNGTYIYTPDQNYIGADTFTYAVCDNGIPVECDTATVFIIVLPVNSNNPTAIDDFFTIYEDSVLNGTDLLANDIDPQSIGLSIDTLPFLPPAHGTVIIHPNGTFTYTPDPNYVGTDIFIYNMCDVGSPPNCDYATVHITILPLQDPPIAADDYFSTPEDVALSFNVLANDFDPDNDLDTSSLTIINPPNSGYYSLNSQTQIIDYHPYPNFYGYDTLTYRICDTSGLCDQAEVIIYVYPQWDIPVADDDFDTCILNTDIDIFVVDNDYDPDNDLDTSSISIQNQAFFGVATVGLSGNINYQPDSGYSGYDFFSYQICDTTGLCDQATVSIHILPDNHAPVAVNDTIIILPDDPVIINELSNDFDPDNDQLSVGICGIPSNGQISLNWDNTFTYIPDPGYIGNDSFCYFVCDNGQPALCDTAIVYINIIGDTNNSQPIAVIDYDTLCINGSLEVNVLANDYDPEGNPLSVDISQMSLHGSAQDNLYNTITYIPDLDYTGKDSLIYIICDNGTPPLCDTAFLKLWIKDCTLPEEDEFFIPNAFSPNGDGVNDKFVIPGIEKYPNNNIIIFNQWGDEVYRKENYNNEWDGSSHNAKTIGEGKKLPFGTYFYIFFPEKSNKDNVLKGYVVLSP